MKKTAFATEAALDIFQANYAENWTPSAEDYAFVNQVWERYVFGYGVHDPGKNYTTSIGIHIHFYSIALARSLKIL